MRGILYYDEPSLSLCSPYRAKYPFLETLQILSQCHMQYVTVKANEEQLDVDDWHKRERQAIWIFDR